MELQQSSEDQQTIGGAFAQGWRALLEAVPAPAAVLDAAGRLQLGNARWQACLALRDGDPAEGEGYGEFLDRQIVKAMSPSAAGSAGRGNDSATALLGDVLAGRREEATLTYACEISGEERWVRTHFSVMVGPSEGRWVLVVHHDASEEVRNQQRIFSLAHFDELTGLPNRLLFLDRLRASLAYARRHGVGMAVFLLDIDRFQVINDTMGRHCGNQLLIGIGQRLTSLLRRSDTASRLGSDEFGVIVAGVENPADVSAVARKLLGELETPFQVEDKEVYVTTSLGIALYPDDSADAEMLLAHAEIAMHRAKTLGTHCYQYFTPEMNAGAVERLRLESELRQALARQEFEVFYQPKVACSGGEIVGAEALLRWRHPERGVVGPAEFIPILEENGSINAVGNWVLNEACRQFSQWIAEGRGNRPRVAVNVSAHQLEFGSLVDTVREALAESGLPPECLELELTESMLMCNVEEIIQTLGQLRQLGVGLSVDDFGTGYSSLAYLKRFPLSAVKVDRSFVQDITADPNDASITRAVITMAHNLKLKVVAEGVETEGQLSLLIANHCDEIQGFYFSRPVPAAEMAAMLSERSLIPALPVNEQRRPRTLLLVDDEENILASLRRLLRRDGYRILTASSGAEGLDILAQNEVDVIVSDQRMSGMTGVEFLRRVKTIHPATVRMVLSGYTELQSITDAINEGAIYKFLTKPWEDDLLRANIEEAFRYKELGDENLRLNNQLQSANSELALTNARLLQILAEQERRLSLDRSSLDVVREVLHCVPVPVIGFDDSMLMVFANAAAIRVVPGVGDYLGDGGCNCLPQPLGSLVDSGDGSLRWYDGKMPWIASCRDFGGEGGPSGRLLILYPVGASTL